MDDLEKLPVVDDTPEQPGAKELMNAYLGEPSSPPKKTSGWSDMDKWKIVGMTVILFAILSFPLLSSIFNNLPFVGGSTFGVYAFQVLLFLVGMIIITFMCGC